jgi:hypothetical protein
MPAVLMEKGTKEVSSFSEYLLWVTVMKTPLPLSTRAISGMRWGKKYRE